MNPQTCAEFGANRSIRLAAFPDLNLWPPKTPRNAPCGIEGRIVFSYVYSQTNPQTCTKFGANRSSRLTAFPDIWIYVYSQMNPQTWTKFGANRSSRLTASTYFWICDSLNPQNAPWDIDGRIVFSLGVIPCQINQWFASHPPISMKFGTRADNA